LQAGGDAHSQNVSNAACVRNVTSSPALVCRSRLALPSPRLTFVPLEGEEIGRLIAHAVESGVSERRPWYEPGEEVPKQPLINKTALTEFDTVVVELPSAPAPKAIGSQPLLERSTRLQRQV
jgi:hypothetical protein